MLVEGHLKARRYATPTTGAGVDGGWPRVEYTVSLPMTAHGIGLQLGLSNDFVIYVIGFNRPDGVTLEVESGGRVAIYDRLVAVGGVRTEGLSFNAVIALIRAAPTSVSLSFSTPAGTGAGDAAGT